LAYPSCSRVGLLLRQVTKARFGKWLGAQGCLKSVRVVGVSRLIIVFSDFFDALRKDLGIATG